MIPIVNNILAWEKEIEIREQKLADRHNFDRWSLLEPKPQRKASQPVDEWYQPQPANECACAD